jgi:hypothetical protein
VNVRWVEGDHIRDFSPNSAGKTMDFVRIAKETARRVWSGRYRFVG